MSEFKENNLLCLLWRCRPYPGVERDGLFVCSRCQQMNLAMVKR